MSHCGQDDIFGDTTPSWLNEVGSNGSTQRKPRGGLNLSGAPRYYFSRKAVALPVVSS